MIVTDNPLPSLPVDALVAREVPESAGLYEGEIVGYRCEECGAGDETLMQIIHADDCPLAGEHGRMHYDADNLPMRDGDTPELRSDHRIDIVHAGWSDSSEDVYNGEAILFRCGECGNADETLMEIRHDEDCSLAGRHGCGTQQEVATDGGS